MPSALWFVGGVFVGMMVSCAQCGRIFRFGEMYTSREVHTAYGFGYAVCAECYDGETDRFLAEHPPFKEE